MIMTMPANHGSKAKAVLDTWSKRCDFVVFFTTKLRENDTSVFENSTVVVINVNEGRRYLWQKWRQAYLHIHQHYGNKFDWFLKADDDTYVIMENLRFLLSEYDPNDRLMLGCALMDPDFKEIFPSGGPGYVFSKAAMDAFASTVREEERNLTIIDQSLNETRAPWSPEFGCSLRQGMKGDKDDVIFKVCLEGAGVKFVDINGKNGGWKLLPAALQDFVYPEMKDFWVWEYTNSMRQGMDGCCHHNLISMHYTTPKWMYTYEFIIYHLKVVNRDKTNFS